jgi:hypothetical protein
MKVELSYFRTDRPGKWYSDASYDEQDGFPLYEVWERVAVMQEARTLPGLIKGHSEYMVLVNVPGHPHEHPHLLVPEKWRHRMIREVE